MSFPEQEGPGDEHPEHSDRADHAHAGLESLHYVHLMGMDVRDEREGLGRIEVDEGDDGQRKASGQAHRVAVGARAHRRTPVTRTSTRTASGRCTPLPGDRRAVHIPSIRLAVPSVPGLRHAARRDYSHFPYFVTQFSRASVSCSYTTAMLFSRATFCARRLEGA